MSSDHDYWRGHIKGQKPQKGPRCGEQVKDYVKRNAVIMQRPKTQSAYPYSDMERDPVA